MTENSNCHKATKSVRSFDGNNSNLKLDLETLKLKCLEMKLSVVIERLEEQNLATPSLEKRNRVKEHFDKRFGCRKKEGLKDENKPSRIGTFKSKSKYDKSHWKQVKKSEKLVNTANVDNGLKDAANNTTKDAGSNDHGKLACNLMIVDVRGNALNEFESFDEEMPIISDGETTEEETTWNDTEISIPFPKIQLEATNFTYTEMKQEDSEMHATTEKLSDRELCYVIKKEKDDYEDDYRTPSDTDMDYFSDSQKGFDEDTSKLFLTKENDIPNFISGIKCEKDSFVFESCGSNRDEKDRDSWDDIFPVKNSRTSIFPLKSATRKPLKANSSLTRHSEERKNRYLSKKVVCKNGQNEIRKRPSIQKETCKRKPSIQKETCKRKPSIQKETCKRKPSIQKETCKRKPSSNDDPKTKVASYEKRSHCNESASGKNAASSKNTLKRQRNSSKGSRSLKGQKQIELAKPQNVKSGKALSYNRCLQESVKSKNVNLLKIKQEPIEDEIVSNSPKQNFDQYLKERFEKIKDHLDNFSKNIPELSNIHSQSQLQKNSSKEHTLEKPTIAEEQSIMYKTNCHNTKRELPAKKKKKKKVKRKPSTEDCDTEANFSRLKRDLPRFNWLEAKILQAHATSLEHESEMDCGKSDKNPKDDGKTRKSSEDRSITKMGDKHEVISKRMENMEGTEKVCKEQSGKNCENGEKMENAEKKGKKDNKRKDDGSIDAEKEEKKEGEQKMEKGGKNGKKERGKTYKEKRCRDSEKEQREESREKIKEAQKGKRVKKMEDTQKQKGSEKLRVTPKDKQDGKMEEMRKEKSIEKNKETQKKKLDEKMEESQKEEGIEENKTTQNMDAKMKEMKDKSIENVKESQKREHDGKTEKIQKEISGEKIKDNEKEKQEEKGEVQRKKMRGEIRDNQKEKQNGKREEMQKEKRGEESESDLKHSGEIIRSIISALEKTISIHKKEGIGNQIFKIYEMVKEVDVNESKYDMLIQETNQWKKTDCSKVPLAESKEDVTENKILLKDETIDALKNVSSSEIVEESSKLCKATDALRKDDATNALRGKMNEKFVQTSQISSNASLQATASNLPSQEKVNQSFDVQPDSLSLKLVPLQQHPNSVLLISEIPVPSTPPLLLQGINVAPQNVVKNHQVQKMIFQPNHRTDAIAYHHQLEKNQLWLTVVPEKRKLVTQQTLYIASREVITPSRPLKSLSIPLQSSSSPIITLTNSDTNRNSIPATLPLTEFKSPYYIANNNRCHSSRSWPEKQQISPTYVLQGPLMRTGFQNPQSQQQNPRMRKSVRAFHKSRDLNNYLVFRMIKYPRQAYWCSEIENDTLPQGDIKSIRRKSRRRDPLRPEESILIALTCSQPLYCDSSCQQETFSRHGVTSRSESVSFRNLKSFIEKQKLQQIKDSAGCVGFTAESELSNCDQRQRSLNLFGASVGNDILTRRHPGDLNSLDTEDNLIWKKKCTYLNDEETVPISEYNVRLPEEKREQVVLQNYDLMKENVKENLVQQLDDQRSDKAQSDDVTNNAETNLSNNRQLKLNDNQQKKLDNRAVNDELKQSVDGDGKIMQFSVLEEDKIGFEVCRETFNSTASNEVTSEGEEKSARNNNSQRGVEDVIQSHISVPLESKQKVENFIPHLVREGAKKGDKERRGTEEEQNAESSNSPQQQNLKLKDNDVQSENFNCTVNCNAFIESVTVRDKICKTRFTERVEERSVYEKAKEETRTKENFQKESQKQIEVIRNDFHLEHVNLAAVNGNLSVDDSVTLQALAVISDICCQIEKGISMVSENTPIGTEESNSALVIDLDKELANENEMPQLSGSFSVSNESNTASYDNVWRVEKPNIIVDVELNSQEENNLVDKNKNIQAKSFSSFSEESGETQMSQLEQTSQEGLIELDVEKKSLVENDPKSCEIRKNAYLDSEHMRQICDVSLDVPKLEIEHESQESLNCQKSLKEILSDTNAVDNNKFEVVTLDIIKNSAVEEKNANQIQKSREEKDKESLNKMELPISEDATRGIQERDRLKWSGNEQRSDPSPVAGFESLPLVSGEAKSSQPLMPQKLNESKEVSCVDLQRSVEQATHEEEVTVIDSLYQSKKLADTISVANHANSDFKQCKEAITTEIVSSPKEVNSNLEKDLFVVNGDCFIKNEIKRNLPPAHNIQNVSEIKVNDERLRALLTVEIVANERIEPYAKNKIESYKNNQHDSAERSLTTLKPFTKTGQNRFSPNIQSHLCSTTNSIKVQNATNALSTSSSLKSHQNEILASAKPPVTEPENSEITVIAVEVVTEDQLYNTLSKDRSQGWMLTKHNQEKTHETPATLHHDAVVKKTEEFARKTSASFGCFSESNRKQPENKYKVSDGTIQKIAYVKPSTARENSCQSSNDTRRISNSEGRVSAENHVLGQSQHSTNTSIGQQQQMASVSPNSVTKRKPDDNDLLYRNRDLDYEIVYENVQKDSVLLPRLSNEINRRREELRLLNLLAKRKETEFQMLQNLRKSKMKLLHTLKEHYCLTRNLYQDEIRNYISLDDEIDNLIQEENQDKYSKPDEASSPVTAISSIQSIGKPLKRVSPATVEKNISRESRIDISSLTRNLQQLKVPEALIDTRNIKKAATFCETVTCTKNSAIRNDPGFEESGRIDGSPAKLLPEILQETQENSTQNLTAISPTPSPLKQNINCFKKQTQNNLDDNSLSTHFTSRLMSSLIGGASNAKEKMTKNVTDSCSTQEPSLESHSQENLASPYQSQGISNSTSLEKRENTQRSIQKGEFVRTPPNVNRPVTELLTQNAGYPRSDRLNSTENSGETTGSSFVSNYQSLESSNSRATQELMAPLTSSHVSDSRRVKKVKSRKTASDLVAHSNSREMLKNKTKPFANNPSYNKTPTEHLQSRTMTPCIPERPVQLRTPHPNVTPNINREQDTAVSLSSISGRTEQLGSLCSGKPLRMKTSQTLNPLEHLQLIFSPQNNNVIQFTPVSNAIKNNEAKTAPASISAPIPLVSSSGVSVAKAVTTNSEFIACQKHIMPFQNDISQPSKNEKVARINPAALRWQLPFYNSIAGCSKSDLTSNQNSTQIHYSVRAAVDNTSSSVFPSSNVQHHASQQIQKQQETKEISASTTTKPNQQPVSTYRDVLRSTGLRCDQSVSSSRFQNVQSGYSPVLPKHSYEILETSASFDDNKNRALQNMAQKNQPILHFPSPGRELTLEGKQRQCSLIPGREFGHEDKSLWPSSSISNRGGQLVCEGKEASSRPDSGRNLSHENQQLPFYPNTGDQLVSRDKRLLYLSNPRSFAPESNAHEERQLQGRQFLHEGRQIQDLQNNPGRQFVYESKQFHCLPNSGMYYTQEGKQVHCSSNPRGQFVEDPRLSNTPVQRLHFTNNDKHLACFYNPRVEINSSTSYNSHLQKYPGEFTAANHCPFGSTQTLFFDPREQNTIRYHQSIQHQRTGQYYPGFRHQYQSPEVQESGKAVHHCYLCLKEAFFVCSNCKNEWYCSKKCQENRWRRHSLMCKQFKPT